MKNQNKTDLELWLFIIVGTSPIWGTLLYVLFKIS